MPGHVPAPIAKERNRILRELIATKNRLWREVFLGREIETITLHANEDGTTEALSNNYVKTKIAGELPGNELVRVQVRSLAEDGFFATRGVPTALTSSPLLVPATAVVG
jgi:tRNA A37 methylthiotransferase MiaB